MKVILNDETLVIKFQYSKRNKNARRHTTCIISRPLTSACPKEILAQAEVVCDTRDRDVKLIARKTSLKRALLEAGYNREERTVIWKQIVPSKA